MAYLTPSWHYDSAWWPQLYYPDSPRSHFLSSPSPESLPDSDDQPPDVKQEPDDPAACFIIEQATVQSQAPPTEVPLRATQASSDMRRMMTVFRLNPFAIHNGAAAVPAPLESARALDAEPITFEFQLDIDPGILDPESTPVTAHPDLRPFSPDFELVHEKVPDESTWHDFQAELSTSPPLQSWDITYPDAEDNFPSINGYHHRRSSRFHNSVSPPYIQQQQQKAASCTSSNSSGLHHHHHPYSRHVLSPTPEAIHWPQPSSLRDTGPIGYHSASSRTQSSSYTDSSMRRWSLPDTHASASAQFLV